MDCSSSNSNSIYCSQLQIYAGSGSFDLSCQGNDPCSSISFQAGNGPVSIDCGGCYGITFNLGSGPADIACSSCEDLTYNLGSGPTSVSCDGGDYGCNPSTINGGTSLINLFCGTAEACYGTTLNQSNAIITVTSVGSAFYDFACLYDQWQCTSNLTSPICVTDPCLCRCENGACDNSGSQYCASCNLGWAGGYCDTCDSAHYDASCNMTCTCENGICNSG